MNKFFIFLVLNFLFVACEPAKVESTFTLELFNNMDTDVFVEALFYEEACGDTIKIKLSSKDTNTFFCKKETIVRDAGIQAEYILYNINDTCLLTVTGSNLMHLYIENPQNQFDSILMEYITFPKNEQKYSSHEIIKIEDPIFSLAEKDYTMLEKFPEYYRKQE